MYIFFCIDTFLAGPYGVEFIGWSTYTKHNLYHHKAAQADMKKAKFNQAEGDHMTLLAIYQVMP
jgi:hypothetical protein